MPTFMRAFTRLMATLLLSGSALLAQPEKPIVPAKDPAELEQRITRILAETKVPGLCAVIANRQGLVWTAGLGQADVAAGKPVTPDTLFRIGSISKMFVGLAALKLVEEGRLDLNATVRSLVPEVTFANRWEATHPVRVVHLLEHTTGWDDLRIKEFASNDPKPLTLAEGLALGPESRTSRWRPGTRFAYCNSGPAVTAAIIEKLTGQRFEAYVEATFFQPLGMPTADYFHSTRTQGLLTQLYHSDGRTPYPYWHLVMRPSGAINASAREMGALLRFFLLRGEGQGPVPKPPRAATASGGMLRRYRFVSRIASGDTEKEGPAGRCGSSVKGADAAERPPGAVPPGWGGGQSPAASGSNRVEPLCSSRLPCGVPPGAPSTARGGFGTGPQGQRVLSEASLQRMETPTTSWGAQGGLKRGYGLHNYRSANERGVVWHGHGGDVDGGHSDLAYLPEEGVGYFFSINGESGEAFQKIQEQIQAFVAKDAPKPVLPPVQPLSPGLAQDFQGWYRPINPRPELINFLNRIVGLTRVSFAGDRMQVQGLGLSINLVSLDGQRFRAVEHAEAGAVLMDSEDGRLMAFGRGAILAKVNPALAWFEIVCTALFLLAFLSVPPFALVWGCRWLFRRLRGVPNLHVRVLPLLAVLSLVAVLWIFIRCGDDTITRLGNRTPWSVGLCAATWAFAAFSAASLWAALRADRRGMNRWAYAHSIGASVLFAITTLYLAYWGIIGIRTWA